jgi:hydrocephalus-inducing protein
MLTNAEHIPFSFSFDRASFGVAEGERPAITCNPSSGVVPPNGQLAIDVSFAPRAETSVNVTLVCVVQRKPSRLTLNVKGEGHAVHDCVELRDEGPASASAGELTTLGMNHLEFGQVINPFIITKMHHSQITHFPTPDRAPATRCR